MFIDPRGPRLAAALTRRAMSHDIVHTDRTEPNDRVPHFPPEVAA